MIALLLVLGCRPGPPATDHVPWTPPSDTAHGTDTAADTDPGPTSDTTIILVSLDGYRWDYIDRADTPVLDRLAEEGVHAQGLIPVFPSKTFPNHYTQVTGLYPPDHGIVDNSFYDPVTDDWFTMDRTEDGWFWGEPIWTTAVKRGLVAKTMFWPGSESSIDGVRPTEWVPYNGSVPYADRVDQVLAWLDEPVRPNFLTAYMSAIDSAGHAHGPQGTEVEAAVQDVDRYLGRLVDGLEQRNLFDTVDLVVVSDHGMTELARDRAIFLDDYIDIDTSWVRSWSAVSAIDPPSGRTDEVLAALTGVEHLHCALQGDLPPRLHYSGSGRIPAIVCWADIGWGITSHDWFTTHPSDLTGGTHGFDPDEPDMHGIFVARGPHFRTGWSHPAFGSVHLYELMARVLDIDPAANDGDISVVEEMLR